ncbi:MAG: TonB-dependent siderophore receptor, partial [Methylococcaceae bacterium]|nr:TonB-dependent siderophore receptor [Methylococcaceae bacterium]
MAVSTFASAEEKVYSINIDAQPLSSALESLAKQTGVKPSLVNEVAQGKRVGAFSGQYRVKEALDRLLLGSGLSYTFTAEDAVVIKSNQPVDNTLSVVTVTDKHPQDASGYLQVNSISATKTDTPIKQIPQSIQVIKRSLIDDQQSLNVSESLKNVSGVVTNTSVLSPTFDQTRIRGFKAEQLVDGFTQYYNPGDRESTVNIDSIEVLKGTNGILYSGGSGSPVGGVVNINSKLPKAFDFVEAGFKIGTYSYYQPYVDLNKVLNKNALFRFTGEYTNAGNYVHNIDTQRYNLNPSL